MSNLKKMFRVWYMGMKAIPDLMYPFSTSIEGKIVRGRESYQHAVADAWARYGQYNLGYKLLMYRGLFHFVGAILFIFLATFIAHNLFDSEKALYALMLAAVAALFYQEFVFDPKWYNQKRFKGVSDWLTWIIPMMVYITFIQ